MKEKIILVTGAAGFIGAAVIKKLIKCSDSKIIGIDNLNSYYDVNLKKVRLAELDNEHNFVFTNCSIDNKECLDRIFKENSIDIVLNLAAQAGVRYSITNPEEYIQSNIIGFFNILEACRKYPVEHLVYASSSSVYGSNKKVPYSTEDKVDNPVSLYAATKKSNELMAYPYSKLYNIPSTGLRFFTVYGPMGRPDMAYYSFTHKMIKGEPISVYNNGDMYRDFTYIDDIVTGIEKILFSPPKEDEFNVKYKIYNIGNNKSEKLITFVEILENTLIKHGLINKPVDKIYLPMQPGDVYKTFADVNDLIKDFNFSPNTSLEVGLDTFVAWYKEYYNL